VSSEPPANGLQTASARAGWLRAAVVVGLLLIHAGLLAWAATQHSPSVDEPPHLVAGLAAWQLGRTDLYSVNPPLVRMLATLPVLAARPHTDWWGYFRGDRDERTEFEVGRAFLQANRDGWFRYFVLARWACLPLSLLGGYVCWRWAAELYGPYAGLLALALWCFCPNVLAHAQMITADAGAAALGVTAAYCFWRWLKGPTAGAACLAGVALGLAELTKMTWLVLFPLWPLLWVVDCALRRSGEPRPPWPVQFGQLALILLLGLGVLNLGYGCDGSCQRLGTFRFSCRVFTGQDQDVSKLPREASRNRFAGSWLGAVPVPVPHDYLRGIDLQKLDFERGTPAYLRGEWRRGGWWYYYLYALAVKVPLGTWLLLLLAAALRLCRAGPSVRLRDELVVLAPPAVALVLVSSAPSINSHLRYVLPVLPFAFVWIGQAAQARVRGWAVPAAVAGAAAWSVASSLLVYPHSLSYFNELAGGPTNGHAHLVDTNIDWGQDLFYLRRWLDHHPEARPFDVAFFGSIPPSMVGMDWEKFPKWAATQSTEAARGGELGPRPGWFAVSITNLRGMDHDYAYFLGFRPVAMAGYSIYIYHLSLEDANRARRDLGLDELPGSPATAVPNDVVPHSEALP
jgi:hypothetical protein